MDNSITNTLKSKILKLEREIDYFKRKSKAETFHRYGGDYKNTPEWKNYWLEVADFKLNLIQEYYIAITMIRLKQIGNIQFPKPPTTKEEM